MIGLIQNLPVPYAFTVGQRVRIKGDHDTGTVTELHSPWSVRVSLSRGVALCSTTTLEIME